MSQRHPKLIDLDFAASRERRAFAGPGTAAPEESSTGEIRVLIDQLQQTANEARHRLRAVEEERDSLAAQVDHLQGEADDLRERHSDAGSLLQKLVRLEQEREEFEIQQMAAQRQAEEARRELEALRREMEGLRREMRSPAGPSPEQQARLESAEREVREARRQTDEMARQRDDLRRSVDSLHRSVHEVNERFVAAGNQLVTLRQARDSAQSQHRAVVEKASRLEDELAEAQERLETEAVRALQRAAAWADEKAALEEKLAVRPPEASPGTAEIPSAEWEEVQAARDAALAESAALRAQIERLRQSTEGGPTLEAYESLRQERQAAGVQVEIATKEVMELRTQLRTREAEMEALQEASALVSRQSHEWRSQFEQLRREREEALRVRDESLTSLASAQKQIERIGRERDLLRDQGTEATLGLEQKLTDTQQEQADTSREKHELARRLEAQRLETIELGARLQEAQAQVRLLSASLAEARLLGRGNVPRPEPVVAMPPPLPPRLPAPPPASPEAPPAPELPRARFPGPEAYECVRSMRRCYQAYARNSADHSHLNELHCAAHAFAEQAREGGCVAVHRLGAALATLVQELYHFPEQITSPVLTTVVQTLEFLSALLKVRELASLSDPSESCVCVVDDDAATRECIIMAMESIMVETIPYPEPGAALCHLATQKCALIILDINMPGIDGYELCASIRQQSLHQHTPVIFVTGLTGPEIRSKVALHGGNDFLAKPFILAELSLKALMIMIRTELHLAI